MSSRAANRFVAALALVWSLLATATVATAAEPALYGYRVVHVYPHDTHAFTEGLFFRDGFLYESTGLNGQSSIRKERLETGKVIQQIPVDSQYFGEGIVAWGDRLIELTWQSHIGFVYDLATLKPIGRFQYPGEGWALTRDAAHIYMSDGTPWIRILDPKTLTETGRVMVTYDGKPIDNLNELEWVKGEIWANVWQTNIVVRIDPKTGKVVGRVDLSGLLKASDFKPGQTDVLNGIAYDAKGDRLFVTGKNWPKLFEIKLVKMGAGR